MTFAEEGGGGRKVKRIVVDALAKRESSLSAAAAASAGDDVTVYAGRAAAGRVVTGADEATDNEAVNRNDDGAAFVIFDRGERTVVHIRPPRALRWLLGRRHLRARRDDQTVVSQFKSLHHFTASRASL